MFDRERYKTFYIPKKSGSYRLIEEPDEELKSLQRKYIKELRNLPWPNYLYGLKSSAIDNALQHQDSKVIAKFDLSEFFFSTTLGHYFRTLEILKDKNIIDNNWLYKLSTDCFIRDHKNPTIIRLPTGAPTSPFISSLTFWPIDLSLIELCSSHGLTYTRYVDDLTFSGNKCPSWLDKAVANIVRESGFRINFCKTKKCFKNSSSQVVTGVLLNYKPTATYDYRHELRTELDHYARENKALDEIVLGKLNYLKQLQPEKFIGLIEYYQKRRSRYGFE